MFETAELGQKISRDRFDAIAPGLRSELLALQYQVQQADFPVLILFAGVDGAGKSESVNLLNEWLDPHWIVTRAYEEPSPEERERPRFWRYWRDLPARGQIGLYLSGWYSHAILDQVYRRCDAHEFDDRLALIRNFERILTDDGALILKFWMHLGRKAQKKRLRALEADPRQSWRVGKKDWRNWRRYDRFIAAAEQAISRTDEGNSRWTIIDGVDSRFRSLSVLNAVKQGLSQHLAERSARQLAVQALRADAAGQRSSEIRVIHRRRARLAAQAEHAAEDFPRPNTILSALDLSATLPSGQYEQQLREARADLAFEAHRARARGISSLLLFEGWDAAGKGSAIRRITASLDARHWRVVPVAAPNDEERAHHYLWRFWRALPRAGHMVIFDRSWYGRVLVERVEKFALDAEWQRAYGEINDFEDQLHRHGVMLAKFWLHISPEEQYRRFKEREQIAYKQWKLTDEDWRNRAKWNDYELAVHDMVERTSNRHAPWTLVEGNDKNFARLKIIRRVTEQFRIRLAREEG